MMLFYFGLFQLVGKDWDVEVITKFFLMPVFHIQSLQGSDSYCC